MKVRPLPLVLVTLLSLGGVGCSGPPTPASTSAPTAAPTGPPTAPPAAPHVVRSTGHVAKDVHGIVKSVNAQTHELTVTVNEHDTTYNVVGLKLDPAIKAGVTVDMTFNGSTISDVTLRP